MNKFLVIFCSLYLLSSCTNISARPLSTDSKNKILSLHNQLRAKHHASSLAWDAQLADYANHHASRCRFMHSGSPYGENLAAGYPTIKAAVLAWYHEASLYSYLNPKFSRETGHFTQLVWKGTKKLGCAYVNCNGKNGTPGKLLVCEYNPPGNIVGEQYYRANIEPAFTAA